jgi:hypothetical protein
MRTGGFDQVGAGTKAGKRKGSRRISDNRVGPDLHLDSAQAIGSLFTSR